MMTTAGPVSSSSAEPTRGVRGRRRVHALPSPHAAQSGVLALTLALTIFVAMAMTLVFAHRALLLEQRTAAQQQRSAQAFAAAEAGLDWATAQLNANQRIGDDCLAASRPGSASFRSRALHIDPTRGVIAPVAAAAFGGAHAICVRGAGGWQCGCGPAAAATAPHASDAGPAFVVRLLADARPGIVRLVATGCDRPGGDCAPGGAARAEASARIEVALGLLAALPTPPAATVTAIGRLEAGAHAIELRNTDPDAGWLADTGGAIHAPFARRTVPNGGAAGATLIDHDPGLTAASTDRFFASFFGAPPMTWAQRPAVVRITCPADCGETLAVEIAAAADGALVWVDGDLVVAGPRRFGTAEHPVLLVVTGRARFDGAISLHGVLQAGAFVWDHAGPDAAIEGALLLATDVTLDGEATLAYDRGVLDRLQHATGAFVRIPGSWRDF